MSERVGVRAPGRVTSKDTTARERAPGLRIDGEMQMATALDAAMRREHFPFSELEENANVLIFPDLQSGNVALQLLQYIAEAVAVGPLLMGTRLPAHLLQYGATVEHLVNLTAIGVVEAAALRHAGDIINFGTGR